ncbi:MAG: serine hydrolase domain-containing protein [Vicinamibacterales bacterium]
MPETQRHAPTLPFIRTRIALGLLLLSCVSAYTTAQSGGSFSGIAPAMQAFVDKGEAAGVVTLIATKDRVLHLAAVGRTDLTKNRAMRTDDIFWIASMTKPIVAVSLGILVDEGKLQFDDPLERHLPEFAGLRVAENGQLTAPLRKVTVRDVLTHTSGFAELNNRAPHLTLAETSRQFAALPLRSQPGTRWSYSTSGIDILGRVVEVASGLPFDKFLQARVFGPLGMTDTSFWITPKTEARWARPYQWLPDESRLRETTISYMHGTEVTDGQRPPLGGAGLFSTAEDIARVYQMMLNHGSWKGRRVLKEATVVEMTRKQTGDLPARPGMPWGLGFCVVEDPTAMEANNVLSPGSFGHGGAYSTQSWADPTKGIVWVLMFERTGKGNGDNSDVRIAFQHAAGSALAALAK